MKQSDKLDLILLSLYRQKYDGLWHSLPVICSEAEIEITNDIEMVMLTTRLINEELINAETAGGEIKAVITSDGINFCETDSFAHPGLAITERDTISKLEAISRFRKNVRLSYLREGQKQDLDDCIEETITSVKAGKYPRFCIDQLVKLTGEVPDLQEEASQLALLFTKE